MRGPDSGLGEELAEEAKPRRSAMGFSAQPSNRAHGRGFPGAEAASDALGGLPPPHPLLCKPQLTAQRSRGLSPALGTATEPRQPGTQAPREERHKSWHRASDVLLGFLPNRTHSSH